MKNCSNLYFLSTLACRLSECLDENELHILSADLSTLGDMLASISERQDACRDIQSTLSKPVSEEQNEHAPATPD